MSAASPSPESAAMQLAIDPSLRSLDAVISAIRSWQAQSDAQINQLLAEHEKLETACRLIVAADDEKNLMGIVTAVTEIRRVLRAGVPGRDAQRFPTASENRS